MIGGSTWHVSGGRVLGPAPFFLAGIVNVTPDSFFDGGRFLEPEAALDQGRELARAGAHILDVGGESTRPGAQAVSEVQELARVIPVVRELGRLPLACLDGLAGAFPLISVDTYKARVADEALRAGACIINDISACRFEPALLDVLAQHKPGYVLMHSLGRPGTMQEDPRYLDVVGEILRFFEERLGVLVKAGVPEANIVLDPGIGFGKLLEHNLAILRGMERFGGLGRPLYVGLSNKSLWGGLLGLGPGERQTATAVALGLLVARGVLVHRVHDVAQARQAALVATAMS
ncbi:MAG: dihydropteroate synthase [Proteobacteria bacterium]|nr:dihydropteroate synthase [Pseudomonadota bacterium]MBU1595741.1 dihydropteroate synthase [Pseudomonadota bacterium]